MKGTRWVTALLLATVLAGCAQTLDDEAPGPPVFHAGEVLPEGSYHCAGCHYGVTDLWRTAWKAAGNDTWDLVVAPIWPEVPLVAVDAVAGNETPLVLDSGFLYEEFQGTWENAFEVPAGATSLFVRFYTEQTYTQVGPALVPTGGSYRVPTTLTLVAPDGERLEVSGPEEELKQATLLHPLPGAWTLVGTVEDADATYRARAYVQAGAGHAAADLAFGDEARFRFNGTVPPDVNLAIRPYHDHAPFEYYESDWDYADSFLYPVLLDVREGPAPAPFAWTEAAVDPFWGSAEQVAIQSGRGVSFTNVYQEDHSTSRDDPVTFYGSTPHYYTRADPIPPGTAAIRFELTWEPPVEEPDLQVRYGPAVTPYYFDAVAVEREAGRAVFEAAWKPEWWDVDWQDGAPVPAERGSLDIAPYIAAGDGEIVARSMEATLDAYAVRGPLG